MPGLFGHQPRDRVSEDRRFFDERYQHHLDRLNRPWLENPRPRMSDRRAHDLAREARVRETRAREALGGEDREREALRRERHTPSRAFNALSNPLPSLPDYQPDFRLAVPFSPEPHMLSPVQPHKPNSGQGTIKLAQGTPCLEGKPA